MAFGGEGVSVFSHEMQSQYWSFSAQFQVRLYVNKLCLKLSSIYSESLMLVTKVRYSVWLTFFRNYFVFQKVFTILNILYLYSQTSVLKHLSS